MVSFLPTTKFAAAEEEMIKTGFGTISLLTAKKPKTVKMIHKHAERSQQEAKKMEEMMAKVKKVS